MAARLMDILSLLTSWLTSPTPEWKDLLDEVTYTRFVADVRAHIQAFTPLSRSRWICPNWLNAQSERASHCKWLTDLAEAPLSINGTISTEPPPLPGPLTHPESTPVSFSIIGSFPTPPMPDLLHPRSHDSFKLTAHWLITEVGGLCKGNWTPSDWELNRTLASNWRAYAASHWTPGVTLIILQFNLKTTPSSLGLIYLRTHLILGPNHTDLVILDSLGPTPNIHLFFPLKNHPIHLQIEFPSPPSWLPLIKADNVNAFQITSIRWPDSEDVDIES